MNEKQRSEKQIEELAKTLRCCATDSAISLRTLRAGILNFVGGGLWRKFYAMMAIREYDRFEDFAANWMKFPLPSLIKTFVDDIEVRKVLREQTGAHRFDEIEADIRQRANEVKKGEARGNPLKLTPGNPNPSGHNQHTPEDERGNGSNPTFTKQDRGKTYTLRRLARDRPDLLAQVEAGELTANAAAIEAGFRRKPTPLDQVARLLPKLSQAELRKLQIMVDAGLTTTANAGEEKHD